jgi:type IV pilus assembly protein PilW
MRRRPQRGLSLVELMVGITIGLIVVAAASLLLSNQLFENRRLLAEVQVQQDLRATADIMAREIRRSGSYGEDGQVQRRVWTLDTANEPSPNPKALILSPTSGSDSEVRFDYLADVSAVDVVGGYGYRLNGSAGTIQTNLADGGWQDLTDPATLRVTQFAVRRLPDTVIRIPCPRACPLTNDASCWPTVNVRALEITISARHRDFADIVRTHRSLVRIRNDLFDFFNTSAGQVCPP